jgi:outer membrane protein OmpA-like peptidoglycan-associated protein
MTQTDPKRLVPVVAGTATAALGLVAVTLMVGGSVLAAGRRLQHPVAVAAQSEVGYCTPRFKQVLERVLHSCGLKGGEDRRGCKPADVKTFAAISDSDFNELFTPLKDRGAVIQFDNAKDELDPASKKLLEEKWFDRKGARYFFVVARASKSGSQQRNQALSHRRANSVMFHVQSVASDPELDSKVGLLWLGAEFAQLSTDYCAWSTSRPSEKCDEEAINRSAFVSWVDCRL